MPNLHWIIVEDGNSTTKAVHRALGELTAFSALNLFSAQDLSPVAVPDVCQIANYTYIFAPTPEHLKLQNCTKVEPKKGCPESRLGMVLLNLPRSETPVQYHPNTSTVRTHVVAREMGQASRCCATECRACCPETTRAGECGATLAESESPRSDAPTLNVECRAWGTRSI